MVIYQVLLIHHINIESLLIKSQEEIEENIGAGFEHHK